GHVAGFDRARLCDDSSGRAAGAAHAAVVARGGRRIPPGARWQRTGCPRSHRSHARRSFMKRAAVILATVGGAGYFPIAPGTVGSAAGVVIYWLTRTWPFSWQL